MEDGQIIQLFFERSERAIRELERKYGGLCRSIAGKILNDREDAEECVNDALLAVWNAIPPNRPDMLQPYLCRIVRNLSLKKYHSNTAQKRNRQYDVLLEELSDCLDSGRSVEEEILARELAEELNAFLKALDSRDRILFVQRYWYCLSIPEIAENLRMTRNAVRVRLHRLRERLKRYLGQKEAYGRESEKNGTPAECRKGRQERRADEHQGTGSGGQRH